MQMYVQYHVRLLPEDPLAIATMAIADMVISPTKSEDEADKCAVMDSPVDIATQFWEQDHRDETVPMTDQL